MTTDATDHAVTLSYDGNRGEILRLSLRVALLTLASLSFYRFWATIRVRRYFWSRIKINGEALEYSGTGRELFISFVKVVAILAVVIIPIRLIQIAFAGSPLMLGLVGLVQLAAIAALYCFAIYYARRYRLTRTQWRGIRFNLIGSPGKFLWMNIGYGALTYITAGLAFPVWSIAAQRYLLAHTWFGDRPVACETRMGGLFWRWFAVWAYLFVAMIAVVVFFASDLAKIKSDPTQIFPPVILRFMVSFYAVLIAEIPLLIGYRLGEFRVLVRGLGFEGLTFDVALRLRSVFFILLQAVLAGLGLAVFAGLGYGLLWAIGWVTGFTVVTGFIGTFVTFVVMLTGSGVITRTIVSHGLLSRAIAATTITGDIDLSAIGQTYAPVPRGGEGMLEAFDFGG